MVLSIAIYCLHAVKKWFYVFPFVVFTVKWFHVLLSNTNRSISTQLHGFKYFYQIQIIKINVNHLFSLS